MKLLAKYQNGNYTVRLFDDGTKIRMNNLDNLTPAFAESMDVTITERCNGHCNWCYLGCTENGKHADLTNPIFDTVHAGTELAINANDFSHPGLEDFLIKMKNKNVIVNITVNQKHLFDNLETLIKWQNSNIIFGIGISLMNSNDSRLISSISKLRNVVLHVIDGCFTKNDLDNLANNNIKLLILGYKTKGRGIEYYNQNSAEIQNNIKYLADHLHEYKDKFNTFAFDTLATEHLNIRSKVDPNTWKHNFMGDEGAYTFFYDAVNNRFAISSMDKNSYEALDSFDAMFKTVRRLAGHSDIRGDD